MDKTQVIVSDVYVVNQATQEETRILGEMVFGRVDTDKCYPSDTLISRRHFRLRPTTEGVLIEDLGSTNRTKVNGKLLKASALYKLKSRDLIEFGQQKVQIFIGGKILGEHTDLIGQDPKNVNAVEQSMVFERLCTGEKKKDDGRIDAIQANADMVLEIGNDQPGGGGRKDDAIIQSLVQRKNSAWYLQFAGSEFGPLSLKELRVVITSKQFQGGVLYAFTEGLADWIPVDKISKFLEGPVSEFTATQRVGSGAAFSGTVHCILDRKKPDQKVTGSCEGITLSEITVAFKKPLDTKTSLFEIEVLPAPATGVGNFTATVKLDRSRTSGATQVLIFMQAAPGTKMAIERYLRSKG